ncbi:hypothetical protein M885DRAFT_516777 [Pelagophyceae sp. CCMP2097]|nr:hypothetical protein M885DRAFT_516777 [Pelagophyceae sp. CCMP2097]
MRRTPMSLRVPAKSGSGGKRRRGVVGTTRGCRGARVDPSPRVPTRQIPGKYQIRPVPSRPLTNRSFSKFRDRAASVSAASENCTGRRRVGRASCRGGAAQRAALSVEKSASRAP